MQNIFKKSTTQTQTKQPNKESTVSIRKKQTEKTDSPCTSKEPFGIEDGVDPHKSES